MPTNNGSILDLDVGEKRIGLALASQIAKLPHPLVTLGNDDKFWTELRRLIAEETVEELVVGLPRGLDGQSTPQTAYAEHFASQLQAELDLPVHLQDEALTSTKAEQELQKRGKAYTKEDVDALSATYILEDYLQGGSA